MWTKYPRRSVTSTIHVARSSILNSSIQKLLQSNRRCNVLFRIIILYDFDNNCGKNIRESNDDVAEEPQESVLDNADDRPSIEVCSSNKNTDDLTNCKILSISVKGNGNGNNAKKVSTKET